MQSKISLIYISKRKAQAILACAFLFLILETILSFKIAEC